VIPNGNKRVVFSLPFVYVPERERKGVDMTDDKSGEKKTSEAASKPFSKALQDALRNSNALQVAVESTNTSNRLREIENALRPTRALQAAMGAFPSSSDAMNIAMGVPTASMQKALKEAYLPSSATLQAAMGAFPSSSDAMNTAMGIPTASMQKALKEAYLPSSAMLQAAKAGLPSALTALDVMSNQSRLNSPAFQNLSMAKTASRISSNAGLKIQSVSDIGIAIRKVRKSKVQTQQEFADLAGVGRRFLSELESGKPTLEIGKVLKVATAAGVQLMLVSKADE
jgi:y4mF family transcriptional regulator